MNAIVQDLRNGSNSHIWDAASYYVDRTLTPVQIAQIEPAVKETLFAYEKVNGDVMIIDGNGSKKCALLGDNLAKKATDNGWSGFIIYGCIRDSEIISTINIGIKALDTMPLKSEKKNIGEFGKDLSFANVLFKEGYYAYSDQDGIIIRQHEIV